MTIRDVFPHLPKTMPKFSFKALGVSLLMALWVGVSVLGSQIIGYFIFVNFITSEEMLEMPLYSAIYSAITYLLALVLIVFVPWLVYKKWRTTRGEMGLFGAPTWRDLGLAPAGLIIYYLISYLITLIFTMLPWFMADEAQDVGFDNLTSNVDLLLAFLSLVIVAPVAEELIFRGWLYGKMRKKLPVPAAIVIVSLLFGLMHGQWNVGVDVFVMSVVLCLQREMTGTVYSGVLLHMLKNAIAFYFLYIVV